MYTGDEIALDVLCVLYNKVLSNSSVPAKLHINHDSNNPTHKDSDISFFKCEGINKLSESCG
jgi:hypothetical protein